MATAKDALRSRFVAQYEQFTQAEINDLIAGGLLTYADVVAARTAAYRRHIAAMEVPAPLAAFVDTMTRRFGSTVKVWANADLGWLEALLVGLHGEEPAHWPTAFGPVELRRAARWVKSGAAPKGTEYLDTPTGFARIDVAIVTVIGFLAAHGLRILANLGVLAVVAAVASFFDVSALVTAPIIIGTALSNFWENELIDHLFRGRSYTAPSAMHFALFTAAPGETGGGTEVSGGSYARVSYAPTTANFEGTGGETTATDSAGTAGATQNINAITFAAPSANWGVVTHMGILDASTSGNLYTYGALTASKTVNNGDAAPNFPAGAFDFTLA